MPTLMFVRLLGGLVAVLVMTWAAPAAGQATVPAPLGLTVHQVDATRFPAVLLHLSAADGRGVPIGGLEPAAFELTEDGRAISSFRLSALNDSQEPIAVALVIDVSGSMKEERRLDAARAAAASLIDALGPRDSAAVISFADEVRVDQPFTTDGAALHRALQALTTRGDTALYDAIAQSSLLVRALPQSRKVLIVLTDGHDTTSKSRLPAAIASARDARALVFAVGLGPAAASEPLEALSRETGGQALYPADGAELGHAFRSIAAQLRFQYVLRYESATAPDDRPHQVVARIVHEGAAAEVGASFVAARPPPPVVDVTGIANGDVIAGRRQIGATVRSGEVRRIELLVDDQSRAAATNQPFVLAWDAGGEQPGRRRVTVRLTDAAGVPRDQSYTVEVVGASPTPVPPTATRVAPLPTPLPRPTVEAVPPSEPNELTRTWLPIGAGAALVVALAALAAAIARRPAPAAAVASASATGGPPDEDRTIDMNTLSGGAVALARGVLAASAMPRARLRTVRDGEPHEIALTGGELSIGRGQENTVVLEDALVSRRHARIVLVDGSYWLEDLESRNGSRVNDEDVARHQLVGGETIAIGDTMFAFVLDPSAGEPATNGMGEVAPDVAVRA